MRSVDIRGPNLDDVKESVRQGVTMVAGRLSTLANEMMTTIQDKYGGQGSAVDGGLKETTTVGKNNLQLMHHASEMIQTRYFMFFFVGGLGYY